MAANLKKAPEAGKKDEKAPKAERERWSPDWKWVAIGLGFVTMTGLATFLGVAVYAKLFLTKETIKTVHVLKVPPKPGPSVPLFNSQIANLKGGRFLRYSVVLQYVADEHLWPAGGGGNAGSSKPVNPLEKFEPLMKDVVVSTISRHTAADLLEPSGREQLKAEIRENINTALNEAFDPNYVPMPKGNGGGAHGGGHGGGGGEGEEGEKPHLPEVLRVFFTEFVVS